MMNAMAARSLPAHQQPKAVLFGPGAAVALRVALRVARSIPLVIFGSTLMIKLMERFPTVIPLGAAPIGWAGGEAIAKGGTLRGASAANPWLHHAGAAAGALFAVAVGCGQPRRAAAATR